MLSTQNFTVQVAHCSSYRTVTVSGEIDVATGPLLRSRLLDLIDTGTPAPVVIDMGEVSFCDSTALAIIAVAAKRQATARGVPLVLARLTGRVEQVFRITGLDRALPTYPTLLEAARAVTTGVD